MYSVLKKLNDVTVVVFRTMHVFAWTRVKQIKLLICQEVVGTKTYVKGVDKRRTGLLRIILLSSSQDSPNPSPTPKHHHAQLVQLTFSSALSVTNRPESSLLSVIKYVMNAWLMQMLDTGMKLWGSNKIWWWDEILFDVIITTDK